MGVLKWERAHIVFFSFCIFAPNKIFSIEISKWRIFHASVQQNKTHVRILKLAEFDVVDESNVKEAMKGMIKNSIRDLSW